MEDERMEEEWEREEQEQLCVEDGHPYKIENVRKKAGRVSFPDITKFSTYLMRHYGEDIVQEISTMIYDGELAAICGVDGFCHQGEGQSTCRISPRMNFWRLNKYEFLADLEVFLRAEVYTGYCREEVLYTMYVTLSFCFDERISYTVSEVRLQPPERSGIKLDDYLIPIMNAADVEKAAEEIWQQYLPGALNDCTKLDPFVLAKKMGLDISYYKLYENHKTRTILFWFPGKIEVECMGEGGDKYPAEIEIPGGTILINENAVQRDRSRKEIFHECYHDNEHWLFFRLQNMHNNDLRTIRKVKKPLNQGKPPKNPLPILEWEARLGSKALMLPECILRPKIEEELSFQRSICNHAGWNYQSAGRIIAEDLHAPKSLVRSRMLQLGYWQAQGALNYIGDSEGDGHYISPFMFSHESCPTTGHTFVIGLKESLRLYEENEEFRERIDSCSYVYVDGHVCLNDPAYVLQTNLGPAMTEWANRHVDECCLRFENIYEIDEDYELHLNRINSDEEYNRHYIDYIAHGKELTPKEQAERQSEFLEGMPDKPGLILKALMKKNGNMTTEQMAENALVSTSTVKNWYKEEYQYTAETMIRIVVGLHLPPWISRWFMQMAGVTLQYRGLHMVYNNIINCHYMDTMQMVNEIIGEAGYGKLKELV